MHQCSGYCGTLLAPCQGLRFPLCPPREQAGGRQEAERGHSEDWPKGQPIPPSTVLSSKTGSRGRSRGLSCQGGCCSETGGALLCWWEMVSDCLCITEVIPSLTKMSLCRPRSSLTFVLPILAPIPPATSLSLSDIMRLHCSGAKVTRHLAQMFLHSTSFLPQKWLSVIIYGIRVIGAEGSNCHWLSTSEQFAFVLLKNMSGNASISPKQYSFSGMLLNDPLHI